MFGKFFLHLSPLFKYKIIGDSMAPTLRAGESILVNRLAYVLKKPFKGDIVAFYDPRDKKVLIKRVTKIEENRYFVQGDNKNSSTDSRVFGMIGKQEIIGKVLYPI